MKKCNLEGCALHHEGICTIDLKNCEAKTENDLITYDQYLKERFEKRILSLPRKIEEVDGV